MRDLRKDYGVEGPSIMTGNVGTPSEGAACVSGWGCSCVCSNGESPQNILCENSEPSRQRCLTACNNHCERGSAATVDTSETPAIGAPELPETGVALQRLETQSPTESPEDPDDRCKGKRIWRQGRCTDPTGLITVEKRCKGNRVWRAGRCQAPDGTSINDKHCKGNRVWRNGRCRNPDKLQPGRRFE